MSFAFSKNAMRSFSSAHRVWRWGNNSSGPLSSEGELSKVPSMIESISSVSTLGVGKDHSGFVADGISKLGANGLQSVSDYDVVYRLDKLDQKISSVSTEFDEKFYFHLAKT